MDRLNKRTTAAAAALIAAAAVAAALTSVFSSRQSLAELKQAEAERLSQTTHEQRFAVLSRRPTKTCGLADVDLDSIAINGRLQGSCCSPMDFARYVEQVKGLRAYAAVSEVPADPYDIPVGFARRLMGFAGSITLSPAQQATYDRAVRLSDEHGPCCCHCFRWRAFEGQAKVLIARQHFTAAQIANVWQLEDGCGGGGEA